jgi:exosortase/archaeosortase family protein
MMDPSDEPWGILALLTVIGVLAAGKVRRSPAPWQFALSAGLTLLYAAAYRFLPPLVLAGIALTALHVVLVPCCLGRSADLGVWGLMILSLPVIATLQFYAGYPLRAMTASGAAGLLRAGGVDVAAAGTTLHWAGEVVMVDAPCSGVRMLWTGAYLTLGLICLYRLRFRASVLLGAAAGVAVLLGNVIRSACLFLAETGTSAFPGWAHSGTGLAVFLVAGLGIACSARKMGHSRTPPVPRCARDAGSRRPRMAYAIACGIAAVAPLLSLNRSAPADMSAFPGWPAMFANRPLIEMPLSEREQRFNSGFPGRTGRFTDGSRQFVIRWISRKTRKAHPSSDCFKGSGYRIRPLPTQIHADGTQWSCFEATRGSETLQVSERIADGKGRAWTDISAWYWAALLGKTHGPWWAVTIIERVKDG